MGYEDLRVALEKIGIKKTTSNIGITINRGAFPFKFALQCWTAMGAKNIDISVLSEQAQLPSSKKSK